MNGKAVNEIAALAQQAQEVIVKIPGDSQHYYTRSADGTLTMQTIFLAPTALKLGDLSSLLKIAQAQEAAAIIVDAQSVTVVQQNGFAPSALMQVVEAEESASTDPAPVQVEQVFTPEQGAVDTLLSDNATHRVLHTLPLDKHPAFALMERWVGTVDLKQKDLIRALRTVLADFVLDTDVQKFRSVSYSKTTSGDRDVRNGAESFARRHVEEARVATGQDVPDSFVIQVPVYDLAEVSEMCQEVTVIVEVSPNDGDPVFTLTARHNDVKRAQDAVLKEIEYRCADAFPLVLRGGKR